jgi:hypothetical protein
MQTKEDITSEFAALSGCGYYSTRTLATDYLPFAALCQRGRLEHPGFSEIHTVADTEL